MAKLSQVTALGEIARRLDEPIHRIAYVIRTRKIKPLLTTGGRHFYSEASIQRIAGELRRIDEEKGVRYE